MRPKPRQEKEQNHPRPAPHHSLGHWLSLPTTPKLGMTELLGILQRLQGLPAEGRLLECEAVQGLCQLLEHHVAVLEQSQEPVGSLLQSEATQAGMQRTAGFAA